MSTDYPWYHYPPPKRMHCNNPECYDDECRGECNLVETRTNKQNPAVRKAAITTLFGAGLQPPLSPGL